MSGTPRDRPRPQVDAIAVHGVAEDAGSPKSAVGHPRSSAVLLDEMSYFTSPTTSVSSPQGPHGQHRSQTGFNASMPGAPPHFEEEESLALGSASAIVTTVSGRAFVAPGPSASTTEPAGRAAPPSSVSPHSRQRQQQHGPRPGSGGNARSAASLLRRDQEALGRLDDDGEDTFARTAGDMRLPPLEVGPRPAGPGHTPPGRPRIPAAPAGATVSHVRRSPLQQPVSPSTTPTSTSRGGLGPSGVAGSGSALRASPSDASSGSASHSDRVQPSPPRGGAAAGGPSPRASLAGSISGGAPPPAAHSSGGSAALSTSFGGNSGQPAQYLGASNSWNAAAPAGQPHPPAYPRSTSANSRTYDDGTSSNGTVESYDIGVNQGPDGQLTPRSRRRLRRKQRQQQPTGGVDASLLSTSITNPVDVPRSPVAHSLHTPLLTPKSSFGGASERSTSPLASLGMRQYRIFKDQPLGSGASATVYKGFDTMGGDHVAVKVAHLGAATPQLIQEFESEFSTLINLVHENIVQVRHLEADSKRAEASIVMEWMPGGSIRSILDRTDFRLHELVIRRYLREVLRGLEYLHANGVIHRDLKSANMLVDGRGTVKVSDFGTARALTGAAGSSHNTQSVVGTPAYMAPEVITKGKFTVGGDMWAVACTVIEMATGKLPWSHLRRDVRSGIPLMFHIGSAEPPRHHPLIPPHLSDGLKRVLMACFEMKPKKRPTAAAVLNSPYFEETFDADGDETARRLGMEPAIAFRDAMVARNERQAEREAAGHLGSSSSEEDTSASDDEDSDEEEEEEETDEQVNGMMMGPADARSPFASTKDYTEEEEGEPTTMVAVADPPLPPQQQQQPPPPPEAAPVRMPTEVMAEVPSLEVGPADEEEEDDDVVVDEPQHDDERRSIDSDPDEVSSETVSVATHGLQDSMSRVGLDVLLSDESTVVGPAPDSGSPPALGSGSGNSMSRPFSAGSGAPLRHGSDSRPNTSGSPSGSGRGSRVGQPPMARRTGSGATEGASSFARAFRGDSGRYSADAPRTYSSSSVASNDLVALRVRRPTNEHMGSQSTFDPLA